MHHLLSSAVRLAAPVGAALVAAIALAAVLASWARSVRWARLAAGARWVEVAVPPEPDPAGAAALWANLTELLRPAWRRWVWGQPHLCFELAWSVHGLRIGIWVPGAVPPGLVERAVEAAWPGARATVMAPPDPVPAGAAATGGELALAEPEWFPLRTEHPVDPLRGLLGAAGGLGQGQYAAVQILARPLTGRRLRRARSAARAIRAGTSPTRIGRWADLVTPGPTTARPGDDPNRGPDVRSVLTKAAGPAWEVRVRYAVAEDGSDRRLNAALRGRAHALASSFGAYSGRNRLARHRLRRPARAIASRRLGRGDLVSVPELAALAHLPTDITVIGLSRAGARPVPPHPGVGAVGKVLGDADAGPSRPVAVDTADARYHLHVIGATGSGKSTLLTNLVLGDFHAGRGAVVIDPKGDLVTDILERLPASAAARVELLDPDAPGLAPALNVLGTGASAEPGSSSRPPPGPAGDDPERDLVVDHLVGIFRRIFDAYWGPRTDDILRAACLTLLRHPPASLADVPLLLSDEAFRARATAGIEDRVGLGGFWSWYEGLSEAERSRVIGPVMNKLRAFLLRGFVRSVVGPGSDATRLDMGSVLDGRLLLVRIPKGLLGDETTRLIGSLVVARVWQAATARARAGQAVRADSSLYVDECHNFLNLPRSFEEMVAEARGYRLSLVLAHQHLAQLPRDLRDGMSANARNKVFFNLSPEDAAVLARHTRPELSEHDLSHLGAYQVAARLVVGGRELPAFTMATRPAIAADAGRSEAIQEAIGGRRPRALEPVSHARIDPRLRAPGRAPGPINPPITAPISHD